MQEGAIADWWKAEGAAVTEVQSGGPELLSFVGAIGDPPLLEGANQAVAARTFRPVQHEKRPFDASDPLKGEVQLVLALICDQLPQHGRRHHDAGLQRRNHPNDLIPVFSDNVDLDACPSPVSTSRSETPAQTKRAGDRGNPADAGRNDMRRPLHGETTCCGVPEVGRWSCSVAARTADAGGSEFIFREQPAVARRSTTRSTRLMPTVFKTDRRGPTVLIRWM